MRWLRRLLGLVVIWRLIGPPIRPRFRVRQEHPLRIPASTVFVGDHEFAVREIGPREASVLLMIHGLAGSSLAEWYKVAPLLAESRRVVMIDHRSHGFSHLDRGRFEIGDDADDVAAVMEQMAIGRATVVGYSMGGAVAQELAHRHPHLVTGLVLVATMSHHPRLWRWARMTGAISARGWERLSGTGTPEVRSAYLLAVGVVEPRHARWLWEETHRRDPEAGAAASLALLRFDSRAWLSTVSVPALVIIPTRDQLIPPAWQHDLASRLRQVDLLEIDGARHELPWSHPEAIVGAVERFVDQQAANPDAAVRQHRGFSS